MASTSYKATPGMVLSAIQANLETDTDWEHMDELVMSRFVDVGGYEETGVGSPFEVFTKCLGINSKHPKYQIIRKRYLVKRRELVAELADEGLSQRAIAERMGVSQGTVMNDVNSYNKKPIQPRDVIRYQVTSYTKPETAARKITDKFGADWAYELQLALEDIL